MINLLQGGNMAKGIEKTKETKKKPSLSLKEKRVKKKEKKQGT